jgi:protein-tyrosine phosphatase
MRRQAAEEGFEIEIDSAGTGDWHIGDPPDYRAVSVGQARGCDMNLKARQLRARDFDQFDLIVVMDRSNMTTAQRWPGAQPEKVRLARSFDSTATGPEVPDPYYGDEYDFEQVADMLELACRGILAELRKTE